MGYGIIQRNPSTGVEILNTFTDIPVKIFGRISVNTSAGQLTDDRFLAGVPFVIQGDTGQNVRTVTFSGNVMSWPAGPRADIFTYGIGDGVSTYNPVTNGTRVGFQCRNEVSGNVVLDETMTPLKLIAKINVNVTGAIQPFDLPIPQGNGLPPIIAINNDPNAGAYTALGGGSWLNSNTYRLFLKGDLNHTATLYCFREGPSPIPSGIAGARWYDPYTLEMRGDTSIPFMRLLTYNNLHSKTLMIGRPQVHAPVAPVGKKIAIVINRQAFLSNGSVVYQTAVRSISDNEMYVQAFQFPPGGGAPPGGDSTPTFIEDGYYSTIDVTGI